MNRTIRPYFPQMRFFDAIDASSPHTIPVEILSKMRVMPLAPETARYRKAAGWSSHATVLRNAIRRNAFPHIVLEDDIELASAHPRTIPYASLPKDSITMLAGRITSVKFKDMNAFNERGYPQRIARKLRHGVQTIDKQKYRLTSAAAYYIPSADVARRFLAEALSRNSLTHFDCELFDSSVVTHLWFPSPFQSDTSTASSSDIMPSQSTFFASDYTPMHVSTRRGSARSGHRGRRASRRRGRPSAVRHHRRRSLSG